MSPPARTATALVSGGKDSTYSAFLFDSQGGQVDELVTIVPEDPDSLLFHTPNLSLVGLQAEAWGKLHRTVPVSGTGEGAETEALRTALSGSAGWVTAGAIASSYQWSRLHRICYELGRPLFTPLWGKEPSRVVREEIGAGLDIRLVHLSAEPLGPELIGQRLDLNMLAELELRSASIRALNLAGEGGEYETLVVDAPFWSSRLEVLETETIAKRGVTSWVVRKAELSAHARPGEPAPPLSTRP